MALHPLLGLFAIEYLPDLKLIFSTTRVNEFFCSASYE